MCGILGGVIPVFNEDYHKVVVNLFLESQIRGKHATGISIVHENQIITSKDGICASEFLVKNQSINELMKAHYEKALIFIGHTRYSTSDRMYNQPITDEFAASLDSLVHNGVITQANPSEWGSMFPSIAVNKIYTSNDSELLFRCMQAKLNPYKQFPDASIAAAYLTKKGNGEFLLQLMCNHKRPLYFVERCHIENPSATSFLFASTGGIIDRSFADVAIRFSNLNKPKCTIPKDSFFNVAVKIDTEESIGSIDKKHFISTSDYSDCQSIFELWRGKGELYK